MSFVSLSTTTSTASQPFDYSRSVTKSIERSSYAFSSTRRGQSIPQGACLPAFVLQQIQQFRQNRSMSFRIDAQQQFRETNSSVFDQPGQPATRASYASQMIRSWSSGQSRTYSRSSQSSLLSCFLYRPRDSSDDLFSLFFRARSILAGTLSYSQAYFYRFSQPQFLSTRVSLPQSLVLGSASSDSPSVSSSSISPASILSVSSIPDSKFFVFRIV